MAYSTLAELRAAARTAEKDWRAAHADAVEKGNAVHRAYTDANEKMITIGALHTATIDALAAIETARADHAAALNATLAAYGKYAAAYTAADEHRDAPKCNDWA